MSNSNYPPPTTKDYIIIGVAVVIMMSAIFFGVRSISSSQTEAGIHREKSWRLECDQLGGRVLPNDLGEGGYKCVEK